MATEGFPPDRIPQETRRQTLAQLEEAIRNYSGTPSSNLQNSTEVERKLFEQSRNGDEYTSRLQKILFVLTKRKSQQNLAVQNSQPPPAGAPPLPQASSFQQQQLAGGGNISYSTSGTNMARMNPTGMGMAHPMQTMQPGGGGGGGAYQGFQPSSGPMHPSQHTAHYAPHMHRGMPGMQPGMQPGVHAAQRPMMGGGAPPGMMPGVHQPYGPAHNPMAVHSYPQPGTLSYRSPYNTPSSNPMHSMGRPAPAINPTLISRQQPPMGSGMIPHGGGINMGGAVRPGMMGAGGGVMAGRVGGGYGGPMVQPHQVSYPSDMNNSVQPVMAVPNPSYLPPSSAGGIRQPAPPTYDAVGMQPPASSGAPVPSVPASSSAAPPPSSVPSAATSAPPSSQPQTSLHHPQPPSSTASNPTPANSLFQPVPSPAPPTPLLPASPATSVGSPAHSTVTPEENEAYLRTHHELQNYVPLLTRMMNRMLKKDGEDAQKSEQYMKLKSLHSLLQDDKKRVPLPTLIKCKTALEKMFEQQQLREISMDPSSSHPPPPTTSLPAPVPPAPLAPSNSAPAIDPPMPPTTKPLPEPNSQSLLGFKMIPSPMPTFGNLIDTIQCHPFPADRLPPSKRLCNRDESAMSPGLRREIAHLIGFRVQPVPPGEASRGTVLECSIIDEDLPKVPSLTVCIPPGYPNTSPECDLNSYLNSTPLLTEVGRLLSDTLARCCDSYTLSFLLSSWETSLLRALSSQF